MFEFNDAYIGVVAGGHSDEDTLSLFQMAFEEMALEIQERMPDDAVVRWSNDGPYVELDDEGVRQEYGIDRAAQPLITQGFIQARQNAEKAFVQVVYE
jgi:hypothetical protein